MGGSGGPRAFLRRTYLTTAMCAVVVACGLWAYRGAGQALHFALGATIGVLLLMGTEAVVERAVSRSAGALEGGKRPAGRYILLHVAKLGVAATILYMVSRWDASGMPLIAIGYGTPIAVMVLKAAGIGLNRRLGIGEKPSSPGG